MDPQEVPAPIPEALTLAACTAGNVCVSGSYNVDAAGRLFPVLLFELPAESFSPRCWDGGASSNINEPGMPASVGALAGGADGDSSTHSGRPVPVPPSGIKHDVAVQATAAAAGGASDLAGASPSARRRSVRQADALLRLSPILAAVPCAVTLLDLEAGPLYQNEPSIK